MKAGLVVRKLHFHHFIPIYGQTLYVFMGYTPQEAHDLLKPHTNNKKMLDDMKSDAGQLYGFMDKDDTGLFYLWIESVPYSATMFAVLNHEILHVVEHVLDRVGMRHQVDVSSEAYTYLMQHISQAIFEKLGHYKQWM